ncbi:MAG: hypothetical protein ACKOUT_06095 [Novosphingobium sp.]
MGQPDVDWPGYGQFKYKSAKGGAGSYEPVQVAWLERQIDFYPEPATAELVLAALPTANALIADPARWQDEVRKIAMRDGYAIWRDSGLYREDGEPLIPVSKWWEEIVIWFVHFDADGVFEFMLYGGDGPLNGMKFVVRGNVSTGADHATD